MAIKESLCPTCVHQRVCAHKLNFSEAQKAIGDAMMSDDDTGSWMKISDIKWLDIAISCLDFKKDCPTER
jgi:hypothetical protein